MDTTGDLVLDQSKVRYTSTMGENNDLLVIREYGSTLYIELSRFPHRTNTNRYRCNSLASKHFRPKF